MSPVIKKTAVPIIFSTNLLKILLFKNKKQKKPFSKIPKGWNSQALRVGQ